MKRNAIKSIELQAIVCEHMFNADSKARLTNIYDYSYQDLELGRNSIERSFVFSGLYRKRVVVCQHYPKIQYTVSITLNDDLYDRYHCDTFDELDQIIKQGVTELHGYITTTV